MMNVFILYIYTIYKIEPQGVEIKNKYIDLHEHTTKARTYDEI